MNNRIGIYYAYWEQNWSADFVPYVSRAKGLGFDTLAVHAGALHEASSSERSRLREEAERHDVRLTLLIGLTADRDPASPDATARERGIRFLQEAAAITSELGTDELAGILHGSWPAKLPVGESKEKYFERSVNSMREAAKAAVDHGVVFNVEVVNRFEQFMLNTAAEAIDYVKRVDSPNVKILLDTFHLNIEEDSIGDAIRESGDLLGHFHIGENNRRPPGHGHIPWDEVFQALSDIGYAGDIVMEPFLLPGGEVGRDIAVYRDLLGDGDLDELARDAVRFTREKMKRFG